MKRSFIVVLVTVLAITFGGVPQPAEAHGIVFKFSIGHSDKKVPSHGYVTPKSQRRRQETGKVCYPTGKRTKASVDYRRNQPDGKKTKVRARTMTKIQCDEYPKWILPK